MSQTYRFLPTVESGQDIAETYVAGRIIELAAAESPWTVLAADSPYNVVEHAYTAGSDVPGLTVDAIARLASRIEEAEVVADRGISTDPACSTVRLCWQGRMGVTIAVAVTDEHCPDPREMRRVADEVSEIAAQDTDARERRDDLIRQALAAGMTHQQVSSHTGLTRGRIGQIASAMDPAISRGHVERRRYRRTHGSA